MLILPQLMVFNFITYVVYMRMHYGGGKIVLEIFTDIDILNTHEYEKSGYWFIVCICINV
jgi:hypothetical protein